MVDLTSLRVTLQRLGPRLSLLIIGLLLFIAGWQIGRVMSPYYASHPIIFKDVVASNSGDPQALTALQASPTAAVAAAVTGQSAPRSSASPAGRPQGEAGFFASKNSSLYHHWDCTAVKQIKEANKISFATREDAEKAGFSASQCTKQKLGQ